IPCPCLTDAGEITANPLGLCTDEPATLPPAEQANLVYDDILQYILFSDPDDTLGSIISTANLPGFAFDPATMQTGITYYIAAIAGNDLNGNVDIGDPCLDISNAIEVTWHALPSVSFLVAGDNLCVGECRDIEVYFT